MNTKKLLFACSVLALCGGKIIGQTTDDNFDKKFRFGLRITPQPTWFSTSDKNITAKGTKFGFGFGLNMEFKFSKVACLLTGIGGDFEGGKYTYKNTPGTYQVYYELDETGEFIKPVNGLNLPSNAITKTTNTGYLVKERTYKTTYVTIPVILKLSTSEYNGLKYFGMFGGEIAFRAKALATDSYYESYTYGKDTTAAVVTSGGSMEKLNLGGTKGDALGGAFRAGLNVGAGAEYRLGGTTSVFVNINYFRSFTNALRSESDYLVYKTTVSGKDKSYNFIKQNLIYNAIRINIGLMF
ncbi:MAG: outer membrane beta-barrel protein [Bacteroidia bacterium]|nr:outer membrane beta-barrel protein [Bacteroidia bacterium]